MWTESPPECLFPLYTDNGWEKKQKESCTIKYYLQREAEDLSKRKQDYDRDPHGVGHSADIITNIKTKRQMSSTVHGWDDDEACQQKFLLHLEVQHMILGDAM